MMQDHYHDGGSCDSGALKRPEARHGAARERQMVTLAQNETLEMKAEVSDLKGLVELQSAQLQEQRLLVQQLLNAQTPARTARASTTPLDSLDTTKSFEIVDTATSAASPGQDGLGHLSRVASEFGISPTADSKPEAAAEVPLSLIHI